MEKRQTSFQTSANVLTTWFIAVELARLILTTWIWWWWKGKEMIGKNCIELSKDWWGITVRWNYSLRQTNTEKPFATSNLLMMHCKKYIVWTSSQERFNNFQKITLDNRLPYLNFWTQALCWALRPLTTIIRSSTLVSTMLPFRLYLLQNNKTFFFNNIMNQSMPTIFKPNRLKFYLNTNIELISAL